MTAPVALDGFSSGPSTGFGQNDFASGFGEVSFGGAVAGKAGETISLANVDESLAVRTPKLWRAGTYDGRVRNVVFKQSKTSGKWMFEFTFEAFSPDGTDSLFVYDYKLLFEQDRKTLVPIEQLARLKALINKLISDFDFNSFTPESLCQSCIGSRVTLKLRVGEPYNGKSRNEIMGDDGIAPAATPF